VFNRSFCDELPGSETGHFVTHCPGRETGHFVMGCLGSETGHFVMGYPGRKTGHFVMGCPGRETDSVSLVQQIGNNAYTLTQNGSKNHKPPCNIIRKITCYLLKT